MIKLLLDENISPRLVSDLWRDGVDTIGTDGRVTHEELFDATRVAGDVPGITKEST